MPPGRRRTAPRRHGPADQPRPMLITVEAIWSADESSVEIDYADADGIGGRFTLDLETDCTDAE